MILLDDLEGLSFNHRCISLWLDISYVELLNFDTGAVASR